MEKKIYKPVFKKENYCSNDGFSTMIFGQILWFQLHLISFNFPVNPTLEQKKNYYDYVNLLQKSIIPCKVCRDNLKNNLKSCKWGMNKLKNRNTFSKFIYDLHNKVNIMTGKPKYDKTYEEVRDIYENFRAKTPIHHKKEKGCTKQIYGKTSKCLIKIVPKTSKQKSSINEKCLCKNVKEF